MAGVAGEDGDVPVLEERDERLEVDVVGPQRRVGGPHEPDHPARGRGGQGTALLLVGGGGRVVELLAHADGGPYERGRRGLVTLLVCGSPRRGWRR